MNKGLILLFLLSLSTSSFSLTKEEEKERERVLREYGKKSPEKDSVIEQTKESVSQTVDKIKENLPENIKNMMGDNAAQVQGNAEPTLGENGNLAAEEENSENTDENVAGKMPEIDPGELSKIMKNLDSNPLLKMLSKEQREAAAKMMKKNPFSDMKKNAIKSMIRSKMDPKKPAGKLIHDNPKLVDIAADWVVDEKAIPAFVGIINKPDKAKTMGIIVVVVFVTIFLLNLKNSKNNIFKRIAFKIGLMMLSAVVNLGAFYIIYKEELTPTINIVSKHL